MDTISLFVVAGFIAAWGGIIYMYSKKLGNGVPAAAWSDPHDRKRLFIVGAGLGVLVVVMIFGLYITGTIKL